MPHHAYRDDQPSGAASTHSRFARYAIFYTPQPGTALAAFGRSWFGRANDGITLQAFSDAGLSGTSFARLAPAPGRYTGLHAPVRALFGPRDGIGLDAIKTRLISFAARRKPVATGPLTLSREDRFLVLRPVEATPALDWLAAQCAACFEDFAAAPPAPREDRALQNRFSIALTGPLDRAHLERVTQALWPVLDEICAAGVSVDALSLFGDSGDRSPLRLLGRYPLGGA
jgi:Protein of unknown function (DUF1045)